MKKFYSWVLICGLGALLNAPAGIAATQDWPMFNGDALGTRANSSDGAPTPGDLRTKGLEVKWSVPTAGGVTATPVVVGGVVYAGDQSGNFYARNAQTGAAIWTASGLGEITASALVVGNRVIIGTLGLDTLGGTANRMPGDGGKIYILYRTAEPGHPAGSVAHVIDEDDLARTPQLTFYSSATLAKGANKGKDLAIIGISSIEEDSLAVPSYPCCSSRGGVVAFDPITGAIAWVYDTVTQAQQLDGSSGASVWSTPTYDASTNRVFVTTGNNFSELSGGGSTITSDAVIALNSATGIPIWVHQLTLNDTWNPRFPVNEDTPDSDFGDSPNLATLSDGRKVVIAAQKSGFVHMLDAGNGDLLSQFDVVPFGVLGGLFADSAYANKIIFVNGMSQWCNFSFVCSDLIHDGIPKGGTVAAYTASNTNMQELWRFETTDFGVVTAAGLAFAKGAVYANAADFFNIGRDTLYVLDAANGQVLTTFAMPQFGTSGPSIVGNRIYIGTGYNAFGAFPGSIKAIGVK
jgi:polyvinyl alcohol dehydrogenase (cytochrome)